MPEDAACQEVILYLNTRAKTRFKPSAESHVKLIKALLKDYTVQELKEVIDAKVKDWATSSKMCRYLRPSTLFRRSNFDNYYGEIDVPQSTHEFICMKVAELVKEAKKDVKNWVKELGYDK